MKSVILSLLFSIACSVGYSQYFLGLTKEEVERQARVFDKGFIIVKQYGSPPQLFHIEWDSPSTDSKIAVIFEENSIISTLTSITPNDPKTTLNWMSSFEKKYQNIGPYEWIAKSGQESIKIKVVYSKEEDKNVILFSKLRPSRPQ